MKIVESTFNVIGKIETDKKEKSLIVGKQPVFQFICETGEDRKAVHAFINVCLEREKVEI